MPVMMLTTCPPVLVLPFGKQCVSSSGTGMPQHAEDGAQQGGGFVVNSTGPREPLKTKWQVKGGSIAQFTLRLSRDDPQQGAHAHPPPPLQNK